MFMISLFINNMTQKVESLSKNTPVNQLKIPFKFTSYFLIFSQTSLSFSHRKHRESSSRAELKPQSSAETVKTQSMMNADVILKRFQVFLF